ncbi:MAG: hypothetical protein SVO01_03380 [Thermotogota bacterium]|nr:hypothetical protein [Thermotogota bacterium]
MKTIIIVHSSTGTTLNFAEEISGKLKKEKHDVKLVHLQTDPVTKAGSVPKTASIKLSSR